MAPIGCGVGEYANGLVDDVDELVDDVGELVDDVDELVGDVKMLKIECLRVLLLVGL